MLYPLGQRTTYAHAADRFSGPCDLARFIGAVEPLGDDTFQPLLADGSDQIRQTGVELRSLADRIGEVWKDLAARLSAL